MEEYIKRDALIEQVRSIPCGMLTAEYFIHIVLQIPAADVEPVVRGEWKRMKLEGDMAIYSKCSVCGYVYNGSTFLVNYMKSIVEREHNYCPNCGAHMERSGSGE